MRRTSESTAVSNPSNASIHWRVESSSAGVARLDVLDPKRDDRHAIATGEGQLFLDLVGVVRGFRQDQDHRRCRANRTDNRFLIIFAGRDIAGRDPAPRPRRSMRLYGRRAPVCDPRSHNPVNTGDETLWPSVDAGPAFVHVSPPLRKHRPAAILASRSAFPAKRRAFGPPQSAFRLPKQGVATTNAMMRLR